MGTGNFFFGFCHGTALLNSVPRRDDVVIEAGNPAERADTRKVHTTA
jgi:hypothetical protein